jgi:hypothetical protein
LLVEGGDVLIEAASGEGGHEESCAYAFSSTVDVAFAVVGSGGVVVGDHAGQGADLLAVDVAQFGKLGEQNGGGLGSDARLVLKEVTLCFQDRILRDDGGDGLIEFGFGFLQARDAGFQILGDGLVEAGFQAVLFPYPILHRNAPITLLDRRSVVAPLRLAAGSVGVSIEEVRDDYSLSGNFLASARGVSSSGGVPPVCSRSTTWVR